MVNAGSKVVHGNLIFLIKLGYVAYIKSTNKEGFRRTEVKVIQHCRLFKSDTFAERTCSNDNFWRGSSILRKNSSEIGLSLGKRRKQYVTMTISRVEFAY